MVSNLIRPHIFSVVLLTPNDNSWNEPPEEIALYLLLKPVLSALQQLSDSSRSFDFIDALINGDESTLKLHFSRLLIEHTSHRLFMARPQTNMILQELIKLPEFLKMKLFSSLDIDGVTQNQSQQFKILKRKCDELNQHQPEAKKHKAHSPF